MGALALAASSGRANTSAAAPPAPMAQPAARVNVVAFGARGDGISDDGPAFRAAYDALPTAGGVIEIPRPQASYRVSGKGASLAAPKVIVPISKPDVWVLGVGEPIIFMDDFSRADAEAIRETAGVDIFTVFSFIGTRGGGVEGIRFTGLSDGKPFAVGSGRAKAIGITNSSGVRISRVGGIRIVGNVVNARGTTSLTSTADVSVTDSYAEGCNESGFNFMGGTSRIVFANNISRDNGYHGLETGSFHLTVTGNVFTGNKDGMTHVGRYATITGNLFAGNRIAGFNHQWNRDGDFDGSFNLLSGNTLSQNGSAGVLSSSNTHDNVIAGNLIVDNGSKAYPGFGVRLAEGCHRFEIANNFIRGGARAVAGVHSADAGELVVRANTISGFASSIVAEGSGRRHVYDANVIDRPPAISRATSEVTLRPLDGARP